ncbi:MAG: undecaprenyldiphospho-muramoylpentapeptide beta-N-acetylglucosaminyltransferase [Gammaproteobacteria bacterium]|nr:undecaprenyldiphospho-muramoylpentapeptide beta-N-acetylglucosaminyltransferase [Gammaproteobacteria bacterium]
MIPRILIMAGGTGGHVFPALAVAQVLAQQGTDVHWMGTARGIEAKLVPDAGYPLSLIHVTGLRGNGILGWLLAPFKLLKAVIEAIVAIRKIQPDVVLGLGGFASGPGGVAAWLLRKPLVIHEQNAIPGLTNRLLARLAKRVLEAFPNSFDSGFDAKWVGNPVRESIANSVPPEQRFSSAEHQTSANLLVLGGSLGAKSLNTVLPEALALFDEEQRPHVRHQCGSRHYEECHKAYEKAGVNAHITTFVDDMAEAYQWADLVVCRAGALTIAELSAIGVASLLVPYPYAVDDHQTHNASALVMAGGAHLIKDSELSATELAEHIRSLLTDKTHLLAMAKAARTQAKPEAAKTIAQKCEEVCHG